jgi:hypothetical protein
LRDGEQAGSGGVSTAWFHGNEEIKKEKKKKRGIWLFFLI